VIPFYQTYHNILQLIMPMSFCGFHQLADGWSHKFKHIFTSVWFIHRCQCIFCATSHLYLQQTTNWNLLQQQFKSSCSRTLLIQEFVTEWKIHVIVNTQYRQFTARKT